MAPTGAQPASTRLVRGRLTNFRSACLGKTPRGLPGPLQIGDNKICEPFENSQPTHRHATGEQSSEVQSAFIFKAAA